MSDGKPENPIILQHDFLFDDRPEMDITLRDLFAAAALAGIIAECNVNDYEADACAAYQFADHMLRERAKEQK